MREVSLRIATDEHVCILGPNGSGKSTLIKLLTRECYPMQQEDARLAIHGKELWNLFELRPLLGIVNPELLATCTSDATGLDVVLSAFFSSTRIFPHHNPTEAQKRRAVEILERVGIAQLAARPVQEMSSGEAKRVLIARALLHGPRTLLLDEPGNTLDIGAQTMLRETLRNLAQSGLSILLVTHHVSEIIPEIARVIFLKEGRVVADGPKAELLTDGRLSELFGVTVRLYREDGFYHLHT